LTNRSIFELLDDANDQISDPRVIPNPFEKGAKTKYGYEKWIKYNLLPTGIINSRLRYYVTNDKLQSSIHSPD
jgi:hypothetical protein